MNCTEHKIRFGTSSAIIVAVVFTALVLFAGYFFIALGLLISGREELSSRTTVPVIISCALAILCGMFLRVMWRKNSTVKMIRLHTDGRIELLRGGGEFAACQIPSDVQAMYITSNACSVKVQCDARVYLISSDQLENGDALAKHLEAHSPSTRRFFEQCRVSKSLSFQIVFKDGQAESVHEIEL